jgi:hypothetical protein
MSRFSKIVPPRSLALRRTTSIIARFLHFNFEVRRAGENDCRNEQDERRSDHDDGDESQHAQDCSRGPDDPNPPLQLHAFACLRLTAILGAWFCSQNTLKSKAFSTALKCLHRLSRHTENKRQLPPRSPATLT